RSEEEVAALLQEAEARLRELRAETDAIWEERRELIDRVREIAVQLEKVADDAAGGREVEPVEEETLEPEPPPAPADENTTVAEPPDREGIAGDADKGDRTSS
ncbi:MAG: hypothetical protein M3322_03095, partial [Actinomycetota bacterium]|nr:hypothetical protein [Actinomycetota bacterium]